MIILEIPQSYYGLKVVLVKSVISIAACYHELNTMKKYMYKLIFLQHKTQ